MEKLSWVTGDRTRQNKQLSKYKLGSESKQWDTIGCLSGDNEEDIKDG